MCLNQKQLTALLTLVPGDAHCTAEVDATVGSGISWGDTLAGNHDDQPCPAGITGDH